MIIGISLTFGFAPESMVWQKLPIASIEGTAVAIRSFSRQPSLLYIATESAVYAWDQNNNSVRSIFTPPSSALIRDVYISSRADEVYVATSAGLYKARHSENLFLDPSPTAQDDNVILAQDNKVSSLQNDNQWRFTRIFNPSDELSRDVLSVSVGQEGVYAGTKGGLYYKHANGANWHAVSGFLRDEKVFNISQSEQYVYFLTDIRLMRLDKATKRSEELLVFSRNEQEPGIDEEDGQGIFYTSAALDVRGETVLVAADEKIFISDDSGEEFREITGNGYAKDVRAVVLLHDSESLDPSPSAQDDKDIRHPEDAPKASPKDLSFLLANKRGVFFYDGTWRAVYRGLATHDVRGLSLDANGELYAATSKGIYALNGKGALPSFNFDSSMARHSERSEESIRSFGRAPACRQAWPQDDKAHEPGILEVQKLAIDYAQVSPKKILHWQKQLKKRAWFPQVDIGFDGGDDWGISDTLYGSSSGGGTHYIAPDDKSSGGDFGWDVSFSWDLADIVWSSQETSIDSRAKLMTELRENILDQVTRLYFERRRLQAEMSAINRHCHPEADETSAEGSKSGFFALRAQNDEGLRHPERASASEGSYKGILRPFGPQNDEEVRAQHDECSQNIQGLFEKDLRIQELTALLDGYTGGRFSERINN